MKTNWPWTGREFEGLSIWPATRKQSASWKNQEPRLETAIGFRNRRLWRCFERLTVTLAHGTGQKRMSLFPDAGFQPRMAFFGAPDQVDEDVGERLRHDRFFNVIQAPRGGAFLPQRGTAYQPRVQPWVLATIIHPF